MAMTAVCSISVLSGNLVILRLALLLPVTTESLVLQGGDDRKAYKVFNADTLGQWAKDLAQD